MRSSILYGGSTTLPDIHGHFNRPRINRLLESLIDRHIIMVTAGAGSGKTHAISAYLNNSGACVFWFQLSDLDNNPTRFWEEFVYLTEFQDKDTAVSLEQMGFPENLQKYDKFLHIIARLVYSREQVVFVFDDFHLIKEASILRFVKNLVLAKLENLCIIINSRETLSMSLAGMADDMAIITSDELYFTYDETDEYLRMQGITLTERDVNRVQAFTEGWPLALYLVGLSISKGGMVSNDLIAGAAPLIFEMIEKELFSKYSSGIQDFLIKASLLNSFPEGIIDVLAGGYDMSEFLKGNMFVSYNPYTRYYSFHNLFLEFLNGKQKYLANQEVADTYLKAAEWCAANGQKLEALSYYDKCGQYDKILDIMLNFGVAIFTKAIAELYISLIDKFSPEIMENNPMLHVHRAGLLHNNAEVHLAIDELVQTKNRLESLAPSRERDAVLGEVYCMLGLINLGMANYDFADQLKKAGEYLPNGSAMINNSGMIVNTRYSIMMSAPVPGELKRMEKTVFEVMPGATKTMRGYGQGFEYLASAEAAYFTGDMKKAAKNAYEAVYRAREGRVADVASSGYFLLMRIEAASGNYNGVAANLEQMKAYVDGLEDGWNFNGMPDIADGWFNIMMGNTERIAGWLIDDILGSGTLAPYSMGMEISIKAGYLLKESKYYELLAWLNTPEKQIRKYDIWIILIDILIYKALASHYIHDEGQAASALREAYEIAHGNRLITQFVEHGNDIRNVIYNVRQSESNDIPAAWLDEVYTKAGTYEKHIRSVRAQYNKASGQPLKPQIKVTKREKEMLNYLCQGLTNAEIADKCFITISAVKKTLNNIYIKLGATNRADAVRTALQMELIV